MSDSLLILEGDRIEVCEGSWAGRTGKVLVPGSPSSLVLFDDDNTSEWVVNCTMAEYAEEEVEDHAR